MIKKNSTGKVPPRLSSGKDRETSFQSIWSGTISFSLVAIPVQLVKAVEPGRVSFRMLHGTDFSPLLRRMYCPEEGKIVGQDEIIRGFETAPGRYIVITDEELESVSPQRSRTIEIVRFTDINEIDRVCYNHPYYLVPARGGEKAYSLLSEIMRRTGKAGIARFVLGEREYLVAIKSTGGVLNLITLHYSEEILSDGELAPEADAIDAGEKARIKKTIRKMTTDFAPGKYSDRRRGKIVTFLKKKLKEKAAVEAPEALEEEAVGPADLMAALQESMSRVKKIH